MRLYRTKSFSQEHLIKALTVIDFIVKLHSQQLDLRFGELSDENIRWNAERVSAVTAFILNGVSSSTALITLEEILIEDSNSNVNVVKAMGKNHKVIRQYIKDLLGED